MTRMRELGRRMGLTAAAAKATQGSTIAAPARRASLRSRPDTPPATLGARLRTETATAHAEAERAFELPRRLRSAGDYADALQVLDAFARAGEPHLQALDGALPPSLRDGGARRRARLAADLAALGRVVTHAGAPLTSAPEPAPHRAELDHALGVLYVHEGAALGGLLIAAEVRRSLPTVAAAGATSFFTGEGRATAARWRLVTATLAAWAPPESERAERVLAGARHAFVTFTETLQVPTA